MTNLVKVADRDEFEAKDRKLVEIDGVEIGVFHVDGEFHAILNNCPHQNGPLATGLTNEQVVADVPDTGERPEERYDSDSTVFRCPLHSWGFDVETGENVADPENAPGVPTFDVVVEPDEIFLAI
jgi:nitrite reductase/ring-hydroxylating ferredoxin subunit